MKTTHCCKYNNVYDSYTRRYRCCKNKICHNYNFCMTHYKLLYTEQAILIQKMYKGYYIRKKLQIYFNLPRDLQRKIVWHMNSDLYLKNFNSSVSKIIYRRYNEFYNKYIYFVPYNTLHIYIHSEIFPVFYSDLISLLKLSIKYFSIIKINKIPYFYYIKKILYDNTKTWYYRNNKNDTNNKIIELYSCCFFEDTYSGKNK